MSREMTHGVGADRRTLARVRRAMSWWAVACVAAIGVAQAAGAAVCRVTPDGVGGHDGGSWAQAMDLPSALGDPACSEVWVREGVYKPTAGPDRGVSFVVRPGVAVYGGFAGTETDRDQRDPAARRSVLSGDIDGNDSVDALGVTAYATDIVGDNSYHVVRLDGGTAADTVLDGFILSGGLADSTDGSAPENGGGGGLLCNGNGSGQACSPTLRNLVFRGNSGGSGGGMLCLGQNGGTCGATLEGVAFVGNAAGMGGGLLNVAIEAGTSRPIVDNATFSGNSASQVGGGIGNLAANGGSSNAMLRNVTFSGNDAANGGALASLSLSGTSQVELSNAILWGDAPNEVALSNDASITLSHSLVQGGCPAGATCTDAIVGDPHLGALQDTGGATPARPLGAGSAALDAVACDGSPASDQRGIARPQGVRCDVGAVEARQAHLHVAVSGGGKVDALIAPSLLGATIADCRQAQGTCSAWYRAEPDAAAVTLTLRAEAGNAVQSASGCGGVLAGGGFTFTTGALAGDCTVDVVFAPAMHGIGGTVTGLAGSGLALALNGNEVLPVGANGRFAFDTMIAHGGAYAVTVHAQPSQPAQACVVVNGSGTVGDGDVADVVVHCGAAATYTVGGRLVGLASGASVTLSINGGSELTLAADGAYAFAPRFAPGDGYLVALTAQPAGQHCTLSRSEGTVGSANVTNVDVNCMSGGAQLQLSVTDDGAYARYGQVRKYVVTLNNAGNDTAENVAVTARLDPAFDVAHMQWTCIAGAPGASCTAEGAGGFADSATLPPGTRLVWIVRVPIRGDSDAADATFVAQAEGASEASDTDTLVIYRDGLDVPYAD